MAEPGDGGKGNVRLSRSAFPGETTQAQADHQVGGAVVSPWGDVDAPPHLTFRFLNARLVMSVKSVIPYLYP